MGRESNGFFRARAEFGGDFVGEPVPRRQSGLGRAPRAGCKKVLGCGAISVMCSLMRNFSPSPSHSGPWPFPAQAPRSNESAAAGDGDCAAPVAVSAPLDGPLQPMSRVENLRSSCKAAAVRGLAPFSPSRTLRVDGEALFLAVDPEKLTTRLERAACWTCAPTTRRSAGANPLDPVRRGFLEARRAKAFRPASNWLDNAGLTHGQGRGAFLSGDLCPSHRALDRGFLQSLEQGGDGDPYRAFDQRALDGAAPAGFLPGCGGKRRKGGWRSASSTIPSITTIGRACPMGRISCSFPAST